MNLAGVISYVKFKSFKFSTDFQSESGFEGSFLGFDGGGMNDIRRSDLWPFEVLINSSGSPSY